MSIITPEEENALDPVYGDAKTSLDRFCEYDESLQEGCRRTQTMLAIEELYGTSVIPEMEWGYWDLFCVLDNKVYVDKTWLEWNIEDDASDDNSNDPVNTDLAYVQEKAGADWLVIDMDKIQAIVDDNNYCLPALIDSNDRFYRFKDVGDFVVTTDNITKDILTMIEADLSSEDVNPLLNDLKGSIYLSNDRAYCPNLLAYGHNPLAKFGLLLSDDNDDVFFYPFNELTAEQEEFVNKLVSSEGLTGVEIVNL